MNQVLTCSGMATEFDAETISCNRMMGKDSAVWQSSSAISKRVEKQTLASRAAHAHFTAYRPNGLGYTCAMRRAIVACLLWLFFGTCLLAQAPAAQQQKERWNKVYASSEATFNRQPNAFLLKSVEGKSPGTALEIGMGQGRNTIAMARLGWDVTGIDISDEGIRQAVAEAKKQNVTIHPILASADEFDYGSARYDLIYATFEHQIVTNNAAKIIAALKPGGMVVIEGFQEDVSKEVGRPLGHRVNELPRAFDQLRVFYYEDLVGPADWNAGKPAPIVRFIARKEQK